MSVEEVARNITLIAGALTAVVVLAERISTLFRSRGGPQRLPPAGGSTSSPGDRPVRHLGAP
jgi:hypothetical protein